MKLANKEITYTTQEVENLKALMESKEMSKGAAIRKLFAEGYEVKKVSEALGIRYNHCYNVIQNEILVHGLEVERGDRGSGSTKKQEVLKLLEEGKTIREISEELKMLYNSVWQIAKQAGLTPKQKAEAAKVTEEIQASAVEPKTKKTKKTKKTEVA